MAIVAPKKVGFILRHAPYGNSLAQDALDAVLTMSAYEQVLTLVFLGDGVFQLLKNQKGSTIQQKSLEKQLCGLGLYEVEQLFVCQQSLTERQLSLDELCIPSVTPLVPEALADLVHTQDILLSF